MGIRNNNISKLSIKRIYRQLIVKTENEEGDATALKRRLEELESRMGKNQELEYSKSLLTGVITDVEDHQDTHGISVELYKAIKGFLHEQ